MPEKTVVCVLKAGSFTPRPGLKLPNYGPQHVIWLRDQFRTQVRGDHRFVCMSDVEVPGVETVQLRDNLPGWWSKIELFRDFQCAAYVDLDTVVVGDVGRYLFADHRFTVSAGISIRGPREINTSLMCWDGDYRWIYEQFMADKDRIIAEYTRNSRWGDQGFLRDAATGRVTFDLFQTRFPGSVVTYRLNQPRVNSLVQGPKSPCIARLGPGWQSQPRIVFFNGKPKPWDLKGRYTWIPPLAA